MLELKDKLNLLWKFLFLAVLFFLSFNLFADVDGEKLFKQN